MPALSFRDRFFTPPVARAILSPGGIIAAGAGLSLGIVTGIPIVAAAGVGVAAWAARVAAAIPRAPSKQRIDPFTLSDPWRRSVQEALEANARFDAAVRSARAGPLRDRLTGIGERIETGVQECWRIARQGQQLADARQGIDVADVHRQLATIQQNAEESWAAGSNLARTAEALEAQLQSAARMDEVIGDTKSKLLLLDARLDETVARVIELSAGARDVTALGTVGTDVDDLVTEMEALRQALDDTGDTPAAGTA